MAKPQPINPKRLKDAYAVIDTAIKSLLTAEPVLLGEANPPDRPGVYAFVENNSIIYVGEAAGRSGLRDRLRKHLAGSDSHTLQDYFLERFPDRSLRRIHIKKTIRVKWVMVEKEFAAATEQLAIWLIKPKLNKQGMSITVERV